MKKAKEFIESLEESLRLEVLEEITKQGVSTLEVDLTGTDMGEIEISGLFNFRKSEKGADYWWPINNKINKR